MRIDLSLPSKPGVYRFYNEAGELIYIGKAKNLSRRLSQYRNARRCKAHAKMRKIKKEAYRLEYEICESEFHALCLENELIQQHRPKWNVAGAFYFLYPMLGVQIKNGLLYLCYTTSPEEYPSFQFHGAFRSRERTREGFFSLIELMRVVGHPIPRKQLVKDEICGAQKKYEYFYGFRQVPEAWAALLDIFFRGESFSAIEELSLLLLEKPSAVANSKETQDHLRAIRGFWRHEILSLKRARNHSKVAEYPVPQRDRDRIFIAFKSDSPALPTAPRPNASSV